MCTALQIAGGASLGARTRAHARHTIAIALLVHRADQGVARVAVTRGTFRVGAVAVLRAVDQVDRVADHLVRLERKVRPFEPSKLDRAPVCERHVGALTFGGVVPRGGIAPRHTSVGPAPAIARESMATSRIQPPLGLRACTVHVMEDGVVIAVVVHVDELVFSAGCTQVWKEFRVVLHVGRRVLPIGCGCQELPRAPVASAPVPPHCDDRTVLQDERCKVGVATLVVSKDLWRPSTY